MLVNPMHRMKRARKQRGSALPILFGKPYTVDGAARPAGTPTDAHAVPNRPRAVSTNLRPSPSVGDTQHKDTFVEWGTPRFSHGLSPQEYRDIAICRTLDSQSTPAVLSGLSSGTIIT